jgi:hypothetical protein
MFFGGAPSIKHPAWGNMKTLKWILLLILLLGIPYAAVIYWSLQVFQGQVRGSALAYAAAAILAGLCFFFLRKARTVPATRLTAAFDVTFKLGFLLMTLVSVYLTLVLWIG